MDETLFWRQKLIQFFHDPVSKPLVGYPFIGKQDEWAKKYSELSIGHRVYTNKFTKPADWAATGADRAVLDPPGRGGKYSSPLHWYRSPLVSHPLASDRFRLQLKPVSGQADTPEREGEINPASLAWGSAKEAEKAAEAMGETVQGWKEADASTLEADYLRLYRNFQDELIKQSGNRALWSLLPADTRTPDYSIWDHLKVTCALNYLLYEHDPDDNKGARLPKAREPWLVRFSLGPVGRFIEQARTGRDLWTASYLLSDLMWHAIEVFIEQYGPDCIVYPDLRGNPRADFWLVDKHELLPEDNPNSLAATIPNAFVAVVPRGGEGHLKPLEALVEEAKQSIENRWKECREVVFDWMASIDGLGEDWKLIWKRQNDLPLRIVWNAVRWRKPEPIDDPHSLAGPALPARKADAPARNPSEKDREAIAARAERLRPWVPRDVWIAYEQARGIFARLNLGYLQNERGFDYALTHHQLSARHQLYKQTPEPLPDYSEPGEKCTLCGEREALWSNDGQGHEGIDARRSKVREFWARKELDPDKTGAERLCSVCATKRFLVETGRDTVKREPIGLTPTWAGPRTTYEQVVDDKTRKVRQPFPSTSMIAAQTFLVALDKQADKLSMEINAVVAACRSADRQRTAFPDALAQLAPLHRSGPLRDFLEYDPQDTLFPTALEGEIVRLRNQGEGADAEKLQRLQDAVKALLKASAKQGITAPNTRIAVIKIDGDRMGELLMGAGERMGAHWQDVLHPDMLAKIEDAGDENNPFIEADWPELLQARRLMGPSLHAFISRALGHFAHRIVPWVVEREFSGRLIYTGGDDVLCLAPGDEALGIAARLQQLWSAAWVVDRGNPDGKVNGYHSEWAWRLPGWKGEYDQRTARKRFQALSAAEEPPIQWPVIGPEALEKHVSGASPLSIDADHPLDGEILPMLGPAQSLSAGIAFAHFKTSMSHLVRTTEHLLDDVAKNKAGRGAVAVKLFSRNADKAEFALKWRDEDDGPGREITAHRRLQKVIDDFQKGDIPARLPYKLREQLCMVGLIEEWPDQEKGGQLRRGMLRSAAEVRIDEDALLALWEQGVKLYPDDPERSLEGLLFCRAMTGNAMEEE